MHEESTSPAPSTCPEDRDSTTEEDTGSEHSSEPDLPFSLAHIKSWVQAVQKTGPIQPLRKNGDRWRVLLPCAGWDCPGRAMTSLGVAFDIVGAWETDKDAGAVLKAMYPGHPALHIGPDDGDFMKVNPDDVPNVDLYIAGFPCPPWSSMGLRRGWRDPRGAVLRKGIDVLQNLLERGTPSRGPALKAFIFENVSGILRYRIDKVIERMLPEGWALEVIKCDSKTLGHSRPRVYMVGHRTASGLTVKHMMTPMPRRTLIDVVKFSPNDITVMEDAISDLSYPRHKKLQMWLRVLKDDIRDQSKKGQVACFPIDRNPHKSHASYRTDDRAPCLRTCGPLWVVSLGVTAFGPDDVAILRPLWPAERCLLQGIDPASIPSALTDAAIIKGTGNAMTVPVIGGVLAGIFRFLEARAAQRARVKAVTRLATR